jgi:galactofuranosylgalactofuranosylrhamnosyl-N-acetylglucosaminyl-diphospho-decaprenol beta-1,5/1,6-galactofuranosyltransferase
MLDLHHPTRLYAWAEVVDTEPFMWRASTAVPAPLDLSECTLDEIDGIEAPVAADYNGWWMCLIPLSTIRAIGLPIPAFLKWDDAEFCLRAGASGVPTVTVPGVALWHVSWTGKDDQVDWQAYFHIRNRLVTALLHSQHDHGGSVLEHSRRVDLKMFAAMEYYTVEVRLRALRDILSGPSHLHGSLRRMRQALVEIDVPEAGDQVPWVPSADDRRRAPRPRTPAPTGARRATMALWWTLTQYIRDGGTALARTGRFVGDPAHWWELGAVDRALTITAATSEERILVRRRSTYRRQNAESRRLHRRLHNRWSDLRSEYRAAALTTVDTWKTTLELDK